MTGYKEKLGARGTGKAVGQRTGRKSQTSRGFCKEPPRALAKGMQGPNNNYIILAIF